MTRSFWIIALINFINSLSFTILIPTIYQYGREFNLSDIETSFLFSIFSIAQFFATPIIGKLSDRFGRKPLLIISLAGTVIGNLLAGTAPNAMVLFFARFLDGVTGGNISVAQAVIADVTTKCHTTNRRWHTERRRTHGFRVRRYVHHGRKHGLGRHWISAASWHTPANPAMRRKLS